MYKPIYLFVLLHYTSMDNSSKQLHYRSCNSKSGLMFYNIIQNESHLCIWIVFCLQLSVTSLIASLSTYLYSRKTFTYIVSDVNPKMLQCLDLVKTRRRLLIPSRCLDQKTKFNAIKVFLLELSLLNNLFRVWVFETI